MPTNVGMPTPVGVYSSSLTTLLSEPEGQAGGLFAGLLEGMTPLKTPQGAAAPVSVGKGVTSSDNSGETAPTTAMQDGVSGLMTGLLNALNAAGMPVATGAEQNVEVPATANRSDKKPQDVALKADGLRRALLTQVNGGRMPQAGGAVEQQTVHGADKQLASATEGSTEVPARADTLDKKPQDVVLNADGPGMALLTQVNGGRMPQSDGTVMQQTVAASMADTSVASLANNEGVPGIVASTSADGGGGLNPPESLLNINRPAIVEQQNLAVDNSTAATERGTAPGNRNGSASSPVAPVSGTPGPDKGGTEVRTTSSSGVEEPAQSQQVVTLPRSASPEVAPAESVPQNEVRITGQTQIGSSAQNTPVAEIPAASTEKTTQTALQQDIRPAKSGTMSVQVAPSPASSQQQVQAVTANNDTLDGTKPVQAAVVPAAEKMGTEAVPPERGKAPNDGQGSVSGATAPASPAAGTVVVRTTASSGVEVTAQTQQEVPLFRSASLEVAMAESAPQNEVRTAGQAQDVVSAQDAPVAEIPATFTAMTAQTEPQQNGRFANSGAMPVQVAPSPATSQQPVQAVTANNDTLDGTKPVQAAVVPATGKTGVEAGGSAAQTRPESAATAKSVQSITVEAVKFAGAGSSGEGFSTGDDKGTADNFMNGQFHTSLMGQQGNVEGASVANNASVPVQNDARQSSLSEQILPQVKESLANHEVKAGNEQIVLRLSPENLGELKVNLSMDGQSLKVEIVAQNHMVRDALLQNTDSLKESLARQNISMQSFNVTTGNPGQRQQQGNWRESDRQQQNAWMTSAGYKTSDTAVAATRLAYQPASAHTMVDLHF
jgi:flagellar hook-length control protein FliK